MHPNAPERSETFVVGETARLKLTNIRGRVDIQHCRKFHENTDRRIAFPAFNPAQMPHGQARFAG